MSEEELKEVIKAKNKPIRDVIELSKYFIGRRNGIVYVTESLRIDLDKRMSSLGRLKVENEELIISYRDKTRTKVINVQISNISKANLAVKF